MDHVTVTDGCTEGFNEKAIHGYKTVSFMNGEGSLKLIICLIIRPMILAKFVNKFSIHYFSQRVV